MARWSEFSLSRQHQPFPSSRRRLSSVTSLMGANIQEESWNVHERGPQEISLRWRRPHSAQSQPQSKGPLPPSFLLPCSQRIFPYFLFGTQGPMVTRHGRCPKHPMQASLLAVPCHPPTVSASSFARCCVEMLFSLLRLPTHLFLLK